MSPRIPSAITLVLALSLFASFAVSARIPDDVVGDVGGSEMTAKHSKRQSVSVVAAQTVTALVDLTFFAAAAQCDPLDIFLWDCGTNCEALPTFIPSAVGGDGDSTTPFWYVGYWPDRNAVIVAHQSTDVDDLFEELVEGDFSLESLDPELFPGLSSDLQVHSGFAATHESTADDILAAVVSLLAAQTDPFPNSIGTIGSGLGGALALLDLVFLNAQLKGEHPNLAFNFVGFGTPRVGNEAFADHIDGIFGAPALQVTNEKDVIPILPPIASGFVHPNEEFHIQDGIWETCPGHDNPSTLCIVGAVPTVDDGDIADNAGPYNGVAIEC